MISEVSIKNFKSLRDVHVKLERFTVFVGPNASGKTSVLQAINQLCTTDGQERKAIQLLPSGENAPVFRLKSRWSRNLG